MRMENGQLILYGNALKKSDSKKGHEMGEPPYS